MAKVTFTDRFDLRLPGGEYRLFKPGTQIVTKEIADAAIAKGRAVMAEDLPAEAAAAEEVAPEPAPEADQDGAG
jgi:hypothetical protein